MLQASSLLLGLGNPSRFSVTVSGEKLNWIVSENIPTQSSRECWNLGTVSVPLETQVQMSITEGPWRPQNPANIPATHLAPVPMSFLSLVGR